MATDSFTTAELRCRCGCGGVPPTSFQRDLEDLRKVYDLPMRLSSAWRCPGYNDRVSSTGQKGPHTHGAVDVLVWGEAAWRLVRIATIKNWSGIGISQKGPHEQRFIHLDRLQAMIGRPRPTIWSYS